MSRLKDSIKYIVRRELLIRLQQTWTNTPTLVEMHTLLMWLVELIYSVYYELDEDDNNYIKSGPVIASEAIIPKYKIICKSICSLRNINAHSFGAYKFYEAENYALRNWTKVTELYHYMEDYIKAELSLYKRCKKYHIQDVETEINTLLNQYCCDDIVELVVMMRADGTL